MVRSFQAVPKDKVSCKVVEQAEGSVEVVTAERLPDAEAKQTRSRHILAVAAAYGLLRRKSPRLASVRGSSGEEKELGRAPGRQTWKVDRELADPGVRPKQAGALSAVLEIVPETVKL